MVILEPNPIQRPPSLFLVLKVDEPFIQVNRVYVFDMKDLIVVILYQSSKNLSVTSPK